MKKVVSFLLALALLAALVPAASAAASPREQLELLAAYARKIAEHAGDAGAFYSYYDVDKDGTDDLILRAGEPADYTYTVYAAESGGLRSVGSFTVGDSYLYAIPGQKILRVYQIQDRHETVREVGFSGSKITLKTVLDRTLGPGEQEGSTLGELVVYPASALAFPDDLTGLQAACVERMQALYETYCAGREGRTMRFWLPTVPGSRYPCLIGAADPSETGQEENGALCVYNGESFEPVMAIAGGAESVRLTPDADGAVLVTPGAQDDLLIEYRAGTYQTAPYSGSVGDAAPEIVSPGAFWFPIAAPADFGVTLSEKNPGSVTLSWTPTPGADRYLIWCYERSMGQFRLLGAVSGGRDSCPVGYLTLNATYLFKIQAVSHCSTVAYSNGKTGYNGVYSGMTPTVVVKISTDGSLAAPCDLRAASRQYGSAYLKWDPVSGAEKYEIYRKTGDEGYVKVGTAKTAEWTESGLTPGVEYAYRVKAVRTVNGKTVRSADSAPVSLKAGDSLGTPQELAASTESAGVIELSWSAVAGAQVYEVLRYSSAARDYVPIGRTKSLSFADPNVYPGSAYIYRVRAVRAGASGEKAGSPAVPVKATASEFPGVPRDLRSVRGVSGATLSWSAVIGASEYEIFKYSGKTGEYESVARTKETSCTVQGMFPTYTYYYKVRALRSAGGETYAGGLSAAVRTALLTFGDADGDGSVTAADARLTLRAAVSLESIGAEQPAFLQADADRDGTLTAADARLILRAAVGLYD